MEDLLFNKTDWNLIIESRDSNIVIGSPHHAIGGVTSLPCLTHEVSDENTGLIAKAISEILKVNLIIACNARVDPNKNQSTEYFKQIEKWAPKYLIEIHGHGGVRVNKRIIEISSGTKDKEIFSQRFSSILQSHLNKNDDLKNYSINSDFDHLVFKASKTITITDKRWLSYHIELPPSLRKNEEDKLPEVAADLINVIAQTIKEVSD